MKESIQERVRELHRQGMFLNQENNKKILSQNDLLVTVLYGSQNYGLDDEKSDIDVKYLYAPGLKGRIIGYEPPVDIFKTEHTFPMSIQKLIELLKKSNPNALELISTSYYIHTRLFDREWQWLKNKINDFAYLDPSSWLAANIGIGLNYCQLNDKALVQALMARDRIKRYLKRNESYSNMLIVLPEKRDFYMKIKREGLEYEEREKLRAQLRKELQELKDNGCPFESKRNYLKDSLDDFLVRWYVYKYD